jgi:hypothetical protein
VGIKLVIWSLFTGLFSLFPVGANYLKALIRNESLTWVLLNKHGELFVIAVTLCAAGIGDIFYERILSPRLTPPRGANPPDKPEEAAEGNGFWVRTGQALAFFLTLVALAAGALAFGLMPENPTATLGFIIVSLSIYAGGVVSGLLCILLARRA